MTASLFLPSFGCCRSPTARRPPFRSAAAQLVLVVQLWLHRPPFRLRVVKHLVERCGFPQLVQLGLIFGLCGGLLARPQPGLKGSPRHVKVRVCHGLCRCQPLGRVVHQQLFQQGQGVCVCQRLGAAGDKPVEGLARVAPDGSLQRGVDGQPVLGDPLVQVFGAEHAGNLAQLVCIVAAVEERFSAEDDAGEDAPGGPKVERIVVVLHVGEQLGPLKVAGGHADVVVLVGVVELGEAPVDEAEFACLSIVHDVVWFDVTVGDAAGVAVLESTQQLKEEVTHVGVGEGGVQ
mmetsp:Transcript_7094/g.22720  ORF Transcript_7094/g.22720 Transcript_7094/m.22720 type:complete len:290 (-) Transcript_7094:544-1413(-)